MLILLRVIDKGDDSLAFWFYKIVNTFPAIDIMIVLVVVRLARANNSISKNTRIFVVLSCQGT